MGCLGSKYIIEYPIIITSNSKIQNGFRIAEKVHWDSLAHVYSTALPTSYFNQLRALIGSLQDRHVCCMVKIITRERFGLIAII